MEQLHISYSLVDTPGFSENVVYWLENIFEPSTIATEISRINHDGIVSITYSLNRQLLHNEMQTISNFLSTTFNITSIFEGYRSY